MRMSHLAAPISTVLRQFCKTCGEATPTAMCRRDGPPYLCCSRHRCPPGYPVHDRTWDEEED